MNTYDYLVGHNIKPSVQRIAIMDYLRAHPTHPTVEEIYVDLCKTIPTLSKTTVYTTLKLFVAQGAAMVVTIDEKTTCYDAMVEPHAHFLCRRCNHIYDLPMPLQHSLEENMEQQGFLVSETQLYFKGICPTCRAQAHSECGDAN